MVLLPELKESSICSNYEHISVCPLLHLIHECCNLFRYIAAVYKAISQLLELYSDLFNLQEEILDGIS